MGKRKRASARQRNTAAGDVDELGVAGERSELGAGVTAVAAGEGRAEHDAGDAGAGTGASGSAGLVDVDRAAIAAEAAAIAATAPTETGAPPAPAAPELEPAIEPAVVDVLASADEIKPPIRGLCSTVARTFAPNWEISAKESDDVADALSLVLVYWMPPGALDPKYVAVFSLATSIYGLASTRREADGSFKPLRVKPTVTTPAAPLSPFPPLRPV